MSMVPDGILADHVICAIGDFIDGKPHRFGSSTRYDLLYEDHSYPPKAILGLAAAYVTGSVLGPEDFKGGEGSKCFRVLRRLGFTIVPKRDENRVGSKSINHRSPWALDELRGTVHEYLDLLHLHQNGVSSVKKTSYRKLAEEFGRSEKAYEYRFQNISWILVVLGRQFLPGLLPASNVGARVAGKLERLIAEVEGLEYSGVAEFEAKVRRLVKRGQLKRPTRGGKPKRPGGGAAVGGYQRRPEVKAWVLQEANGKCECCGQLGPFETHEGHLFLEVHHVQRLADGGADDVENAVGVCPNCHRALHLAGDREERANRMYVIVSRLERGNGGE